MVNLEDDQNCLFKRSISSIISLPIKISNCTGFEILCFSLHNTDIFGQDFTSKDIL